jgi:hypothetical protein
MNHLRKTVSSVPPADSDNAAQSAPNPVGLTLAAVPSAGVSTAAPAGVAAVNDAHFLTIETLVAPATATGPTAVEVVVVAVRSLAAVDGVALGLEPAADAVAALWVAGEAQK